MKNIPLFVTQEHPCSYLENEIARSVFIHPSYAMTADLYGQLLAQGFRRSGDEVYKPYCRHCTACVPIRLDVVKFKPNRSQKRCWGKNHATQVQVKPAIFEQAHYEMYLRYQASRHTDGDMAHSSPDDYIGFLGSSWCDTRFVELSINNQLAGIAVVDQFADAWSAVYTFFEPSFSDYSLGVYAVLWQIEQAKQSSREFLYLGFWIQACKKMAYKSNYQPMQLLLNKQWTEMVL
ncbi:MAG: arginyltransferase [Methylovulum sp.]|uniref:arginyltransferase n=1 Tax=Methylovulum sp. TaxID=1916980 RepID=UPI00261C50D9|nr:arginyltransferase [Methylovulum sp.]MDD2723890.1 arginyltransferase [Methylovulum sp.]MDD5125483.1 arginyltransferase [Methylovulum sp.]